MPETRSGWRRHAVRNGWNSPCRWWISWCRTSIRFWEFCRSGLRPDQACWSATSTSTAALPPPASASATDWCCWMASRSRTPQSLRIDVANRQLGQAVAVSVEREADKLSVQVKLGSLPTYDPRLTAGSETGGEGRGSGRRRNRPDRNQGSRGAEPVRWLGTGGLRPESPLRLARTSPRPGRV